MKAFEASRKALKVHTRSCLRETLSPLSHTGRSLHTSGLRELSSPLNEQNLHYAPESPERQKLQAALSDLKSRLPVCVPPVSFRSSMEDYQYSRRYYTVIPSHTSKVFTTYHCATRHEVEQAINAALRAKQLWQNMPFIDRAAIFLRAAELITGKYRYDLLAATMLGQGKNAWQAEIDAATELADFFRFNVSFAREIYERQPALNSSGHPGNTDWGPLEGFVYAVSPFNFTAIGGNLISAPALMGNVVLWKPSPFNVYASSLVYNILIEAGLPNDVIRFVTGDAELITDVIFEHPQFSALNFTGSSDVFRGLYQRAAEGFGEAKYRNFPRMVAETSGKNFHLVHSSANIPNAVKHTIRAAFEYAGQKRSACSRIHLPKSRAQDFLSRLKRDMASVKMGSPEDFTNFVGPVIHKEAFDRIKTTIDEANSDKDLQLLFGGTYDDSEGLYIAPTAYLVKSPEASHWLSEREIFGPVLAIHIYPDAEYKSLLSTIDKQGSGFALTGAVFANDQAAVRLAENELRYVAGNFHVNCKNAGAVIGWSSLADCGSSGVNVKAEGVRKLLNFTTPRTSKEDFVELEEVLYPSNA